MAPVIWLSVTVASVVATLGDQIRERDLRAALVMLPAACAGPARFVTADGLGRCWPCLACRPGWAFRGLLTAVRDCKFGIR